MPFAQWHAPFENEEHVRGALPGRLHLRGARPDARLVLLAARGVDAAVRASRRYQTVLCLGPDPRPRGPEDVQVAGQRRRARGRCSTRHGADAFRWYYFTSKQPWDGYRFSLETVGECVRQFLLQLWNTYGFYVLYANVDDVDRAAAPAELTDLDRWVLSRLAATTRARASSGSTTTTPPPPAARSRTFVDDLSNWYVRRSRRRFWDGDAAAFATLRECLRRRSSKLLAPLTPFVADEIYENLDGSEPSVHLCDFPEPGARDEELEWRHGGRARRRRAGPRRARARQAEGAPAAARGGGGGRPTASARRSSASTTLVLDELNVKAVRYVSEADELGRFELKPNYRSLGPRFGKHMPQVAAAVGRARRGARGCDAARRRRVGIDDRRQRAPARPRRRADGAAAARGLPGGALGHARGGANLELDDELRREGLAREVVHAVQARAQGRRARRGGPHRAHPGGDAELLEAARAHEDYVSRETLAQALEYDGTGDELTEIEGRDLFIASSAVRLAPP